MVKSEKTSFGFMKKINRIIQKSLHKYIYIYLLLFLPSFASTSFEFFGSEITVSPKTTVNIAESIKILCMLTMKFVLISHQLNVNCEKNSVWQCFYSLLNEVAMTCNCDILTCDM